MFTSNTESKNYWRADNVLIMNTRTPQSFLRKFQRKLVTFLGRRARCQQTQSRLPDNFIIKIIASVGPVRVRPGRARGVRPGREMTGQKPLVSSLFHGQTRN